MYAALVNLNVALTENADKDARIKSLYGAIYWLKGIQVLRSGDPSFDLRWFDPMTGMSFSNDPIGISGGLNQYVFCSNNPVNFTDPYGLLTWSQVGHFAAGVAIGAGVAVVVVVAAPVVASAGAAALVAAGVSAATAGTVASATVTAGLGVGAVWGASTTAGHAVGNAEAGNWDAVAYDVGTLTGGAVVGGLGGGRAMAGGVSGRPTTVPRSWNPLTADQGYGYVRNPNVPLGRDIYNWLGTGPTPSSAGGAATLIGSGMATLPTSSNSSGCGEK
jgi:hypothetical protein